MNKITGNIIMRYLAGFFFSFLIIQNAAAVTLCDASCELIITFPDGGSIVADEDLQFTFGTDGQLNLGAAGTINTNPQPVSTDYSAGGVLPLVKGDSITFDNNGSIILGAGGNLDYTDITITSSGGASLLAVGSTESITANNLTISGGLDITLMAKSISITGDFVIGAESSLILYADSAGLVPSLCSVQDLTNGVILSASAIDTTDSCTAIATDLNLNAGELILIANDPNAIITTGVVTITPDQTVTLDPVDITLDTAEVAGSGSGAVSIIWLWLLSSLCFTCRKHS